jgi:hypothetical protein
MAIIGILTVIAALSYLFYKLKAYRVKAFPYRRGWVNAKASIAIGSFLILFAINQLLDGRDMIITIISIVFIVLGSVNVILGYKSYRYFLPKAIEEGEQKQS